MTSHRRLIATASLIALAAYGAAPTASQAGSLLSGYGGPGEGNQAILGAALLNGPPGGGEGGGGAGAGAAGTGAAGVKATQTQAGGAAPNGGRGHGGGSTSKGSAAKGSGSSAPQPGAYSSQARAAATEAGVGSPALGLSAADVMYILLGLGGLALTGALTRQLVRRPRQEGVPAKGMRLRRRVVK